MAGMALSIAWAAVAAAVGPARPLVFGAVPVGGTFRKTGYPTVAMTKVGPRSFADPTGRVWHGMTAGVAVLGRAA